MIKIKLNDFECEIDNYNRNTNITSGLITSNAYFNVLGVEISAFNAILKDKITSIVIIVDDKEIYNLTDIEAEISSVNEYLSGDHMSYGVNLNFNI